jgi:hypothetical protein
MANLVPLIGEVPRSEIGWLKITYFMDLKHRSFMSI